MEVESAKHYYGKGHNCAQAILKAFQSKFNISDRQIEDASTLGRGKAKNGVCGALYAAGWLLPRNKSEILDKSFQSVAGSIKCKEIRKLNKLSCANCVEFCARFLKEE
ncbi:MAG: C_GCAxxG_C_C family protein [Candidatus Omnitrophica bacterium]|nr:C_GCAxxG_C_C family protein [Candidatus Omnitrophota bacterium]